MGRANGSRDFLMERLVVGRIARWGGLVQGPRRMCEVLVRPDLGGVAGSCLEGKADGEDSPEVRDDYDEHDHDRRHEGELDEGLARR